MRDSRFSSLAALCLLSLCDASAASPIRLTLRSRGPCGRTAPWRVPLQVTPQLLYVKMGVLLVPHLIGHTLDLRESLLPAAPPQLISGARITSCTPKMSSVFVIIQSAPTKTAPLPGVSIGWHAWLKCVPAQTAGHCTKAPRFLRGQLPFASTLGYLKGDTLVRKGTKG